MTAGEFARRPTRRGVLGFGALGVAGIGAALVRPQPAKAALMAEPGGCLLMPQAVEGPFYFDPKLGRSNISEGHAGVPVKVKLQLLGADCRPLEGARLDLWHADAQGVYSGYDGQGDARNYSSRGQHFLRGSQFADSDGRIEFQSIFPGWYAGRTTHMHLKAFIGGTGVLTAQIYFPDAINEFIYTNVEAYRRPLQRDTLNATDGIAKTATDAAFASIKEAREHYEVSLVVGLDPRARVAERGPDAPPSGPPPGGRVGPRHGRPQLSAEDRLRALVPGMEG